MGREDGIQSGTAGGEPSGPHTVLLLTAGLLDNLHYLASPSTISGTSEKLTLKQC